MSEEKTKLITREIGGKSVAVDINNGKYYTFNETATLMWKCLKEGMNTDEIVAKIISEFDIREDQVRKDLAHFKSDLESKNLL